MHSDCEPAGQVQLLGLQLCKVYRAIGTMPPKSNLWQYVTVTSEKDAHNNVDMECLSCRLQFSGSANRIAHHLAGTGIGISACEMCESNVQEAAKASLTRGQLQKQMKLTQLSRSRSDSELDLTSEGSPGKVPRLTAQGQAGIKSLLAKDEKHQVY